MKIRTFHGKVIDYKRVICPSSIPIEQISKDYELDISESLLETSVEEAIIIGEYDPVSTNRKDYLRWIVTIRIEPYSIDLNVTLDYNKSSETLRVISLHKGVL